MSMSKHEKLLKRLQSRPKDFTYDELRTLLCGLGYIEENKGKTSGSRTAYIHCTGGQIIRLHRPHPGNELKMYQIDQLISAFRLQGVIE